MESINEVIHSPTLATEPMLKQSIDFTPITSKGVPSVRKRGKATLKQRNKSTANGGISEYPKKTTEEVDELALPFSFIVISTSFYLSLNVYKNSKEVKLSAII
jgi:hypothetical protein